MYTAHVSVCFIEISCQSTKKIAIRSTRKRSLYLACILLKGILLRDVFIKSTIYSICFFIDPIKRVNLLLWCIHYVMKWNSHEDKGKI
jgi:hypothetical protein